MATPPVPAGDTDPSYWDERFDKIERKLSTFQATCVRNSTEAAAKVARETAVNATEIKRDVMNELAKVKLRNTAIQSQLTEISASLTKLASAKLLQQGLVGILLGCLFTVTVKVLGG